MTGAYFRIELLRAKYYSFDRITNIIFKLMASTAQIFLYKYVFLGPSISSYSFRQVALYTFITYAVYDVVTSNAGGFIRNYYVTGNIANFYLRPKRVFWQFFRQLSARNATRILTTTIPYMLIGSVIMLFWGFPRVDLQLFAFGIYFIIIGFMIEFSFEVIVGAVVFSTKESHNIVRVSTTLIRILGGGVFPLAFFPSAFSAVLDYCPFKYTAGIIGEIFSGHYSPEHLLFDLGTGLFWAAALIAASFFVLRKMESKIGIVRG